MKSGRCWLLLFVIFGVGNQALAESNDARPRIIVRSTSVVQGATIKLSDIASVSSRLSEYKSFVDELKNIEIIDSPPPKTTTRLSGEKVLAAIKRKGITLDSIAYSVPRLLEISRAGRLLQKAEVLEEVRRHFSEQKNSDVRVRDVNWDYAQIVPLGKTKFNVQSMGKPVRGSIPLRCTVEVDGQEATKFLATAVADDWRKVPVLRHDIERGILIKPDDVEMVKLNLLKQPRDIVANPEAVVGRRAKLRIKAGHTIRKTLIDVPPLIEKGKRIKAVYHKGGFKATVGAISLGNASMGELITVRNLKSNKILRGTVTGPGHVEIKVQ